MLFPFVHQLVGFLGILIDFFTIVMSLMRKIVSGWFGLSQFRLEKNTIAIPIPWKESRLVRCCHFIKFIYTSDNLYLMYKIIKYKHFVHLNIQKCWHWSKNNFKTQIIWYRHLPLPREAAFSRSCYFRSWETQLLKTFVKFW